MSLNRATYFRLRNVHLKKSTKNKNSFTNGIQGNVHEGKYFHR